MRYTPTTITSSYAAIAALNSNFETISDLFELTILRDGSPTNSMLANLDMNHFKVNNVADATDASDAATLGQVTSLIADVQNATLTTDSLVITPQQFGAVGDGITSDNTAVTATVAYLKNNSINVSANGYYASSDKLTYKKSSYYMGVGPIDLTHYFIEEGQGSGRFGDTGASILRWAGGSSGIRVQGANTSGNDTVDGALHTAAGAHVLSRMKLQGGYSGTEGEYHGLVCRVPTTINDVYIYNWSGEGIRGRAGTVSGTPYGGNFSVSSITSSRIENNRIGLDVRGSDSNVITVVNTEFINNRQAGYWDDAGIGATTLISCHASGNGMDGKTQCSYSGNRYAVKVGQETGASTNAPSGTTTDNTWWLYIEVGGVSSWTPAWVSGMTWRAGGDYIVANDNSTVTLLNCYSEEGSFSQFGGNTLLINPRIAERYLRGGVTIRAGAGFFDVLAPQRIFGSLSVYSAGTVIGPQTGTQDNTVYFDSTNLFTFLYFRLNGIIGPSLQAGAQHLWWDASNHHYFAIGGSQIAEIKSGGFDLTSGKVLSVGGTQVVGSRQTGTAADATDLATAIALVNDLKAKLVAHGLIS